MKETHAHEESHVDQYFEAAISKNVIAKFDGKDYTGSADKVTTDISNKMDENLQKDVDSKIKAGYFKTKKDFDAYVKKAKYDKSKMTKEQIDAVEKDANERAFKKLKGQMKYLNRRRAVYYKGKILPG